MEAASEGSDSTFGSPGSPPSSANEIMSIEIETMDNPTRTSGTQCRKSRPNTLEERRSISRARKKRKKKGRSKGTKLKGDGS